MALTDKCKRVNFIVSCSGASSDDLNRLSEDIGKFLSDASDKATLYAYILHQKDVKEDGTLKTPHFHIVAEYPSAKRLSTFLNKLAEGTGLNPLSISVEKCRSFEGSFQYLIHKNDPDKYQYDPKEIKSNIGDWDSDTFQLYLNADSEELTMDRLIYLCETYKKPIEVARCIGLGRYQVYRKVIQDVFDYLNKRRYAERYQHD